MTDPDEERIAELLALLPPAPSGWVDAARELPRVRELMDGIVERAETDSEYRRVVLENLEAALKLEGIDPDGAILDELRRRIPSDS
jgi:hypothetical protein